jgi:hypothetical protein
MAVINSKAAAHDLYTQELEALRALSESEKTDATYKERVEQLRETAYQNNIKTLEQAIPEAQRRQYQEQGYDKLLNAVIQHYAKHGMPVKNYQGKPLSEKTFGKRPINVPQWKTPEQQREAEYKRLKSRAKFDKKVFDDLIEQYSSGNYPNNYGEAQMRERHGWTDEQFREWQKKALEEDIERWSGYIANSAGKLSAFEKENVLPVHERENYKPNELTFFDKKGKPKQAILRLYKLLRGNGYIDKDGDLIAQQSEWAFSPTASHLSDIKKAVKEGLIQYDDRSGVYILPRNVVKKLDPYYKDYNQTVNEIFDNYETDDAYADSRFNSDLRFRNRFGYLMSLKGLKNLAKTTNKEGALNEVREFLMDHYRDFVDPHTGAHEFKQLPKELNSLNEFRNTRTQYGELAHAIEQRRAIEQARRDHANQQRALGFDPENMPDEELARILAEPFQYSKGIKKVVDETGGWRLAYDKEDLWRRGQDMHNCVGDPYQGYAGGIRNHTKLILMRDNVTAEIQMRTDEDGVIIEAHVNQTMLPYNKPIAPDPELVAISKGLVGVNVEDLEEDDPELEQKIIDAYARGGYVENAEENKLLKAAEGYKGTTGIRQQLEGEADADGFTFDQAKQIIDRVLKRLAKTESGKNGGAFGTPHKAEDRYKAIKSAMKGMVI